MKKNEDSNPQVLNTEVNGPVLGMATDNPYDKQKKGTTRIVINGVQGPDGLVNEEGNSACGQLPVGYVPIGKRYTNDGRNIILSVALDESSSEIGIVDKNCVYKTIVNEPTLGFRLNHQIDIRYRLRRGCEDVIYFTDGLNIMRIFNFSKPENFYSKAFKDYIASGSTLPFVGTKWDVLQFNLFPSYTIPCINDMTVIVGGQLKSGTYNFSIQYLDDNLNPTNFIYSSQLVSVYASPLNGDYNSIIGSSNDDVDELSGSPATDKVISLSISGLDSHYRFYKIAVTEATSKTGKSTRTILSPAIPITRTDYTYDGNIQGYTVMPEAELAISKIDIEVVEHLEQLENKLILAGIKGKQIDYCGFQKFASRIATGYIVREAEGGSPIAVGNAKSPDTYWEREGYMSGEAYALGIVYVFRDGLESPAFHIPGRPLGRYFHIEAQRVINVAAEAAVIPVWSQDVAFLEPSESTYNALPTDKKARFWQVYNTSYRNTADGITESAGAMGYFQNNGVFYEPKKDCSGGADYWGEDCCGQPLANQPIRHHKFPSRTAEPHVRSGSIYSGQTGLYLDVNLLPNQVFPPTGVITITIKYELDSVPKSKTITLDSTNFPMNRELVDQFDGDFAGIVFIEATGEVVDQSTVFSYNVYRQEITSSYVDTTVIRQFGIKFDQIEYPHSDIVGHYFVRAERDAQNRLVLDKGFAGRLRNKQLSGQDYTSFSYFNDHIGSSDDSYENFLFTPRNTFNGDSLNGDYLKLEGQFVCQSHYTGSKEEDGAGGKLSEINNVIEWRSLTYGAFNTTPGGKNYRVSRKITLDATAKDLKFRGPDSPLYNLSWSNRVNVLTTGDRLFVDYTTDEIKLNMNYVSYNVNRNVHPVIDNITYQRTHNCLLTRANTNRIFGGDTFISRWNIANSLFSRQEKGILKSLLSIIFIAAAVVATVATAGTAGAALAPAISAVIAGASAAGIATAVAVTALVAGAIGVTANTIQLITDELKDGVLKEMTTDYEMKHATGTGIRLSSYVAYANELAEGLYVESEVNVGLAQEQKHVCGSIYRYQSGLFEYFRSRWLYFDQETDKWTPKGFCCPETYDYNKDYSRQNQQSKYFALPSTYDCCSDCREYHPNRVAYSEESFQEELTDNYRIFKPNNYRDIEAEHGGITSLIKRNNNLFIQTSEALWLLPQSTQERISGEIITFIGTGEFFSLPPKKIVDSEIGTAGTQHKWASLNTSLGLFIVNELESKVYLYDKKFDEISRIGREYWFKDNLKDFLGKQFQALTGFKFPNQNNPANPHGVGIHSTIDPDNNRILLTKKDYLMTPEIVARVKYTRITSTTLPAGIEVGDFIFDSGKNQFGIVANEQSAVNYVKLDNSLYFEDKSWTQSFFLSDPEQPTYRGWTSMHNYIPNFYIYNQTDLYSMVYSSNSIWKHGTKELYCNYYGKQYPFIIEQVMVNDQMTTQYWVDVQLQTTARIYDVPSREFVNQRNITFNKITAYNERQSTGEMTVVVKNEEADSDYLHMQILDTPGIIVADRNESDWTLNDFRDNIIDPTKPLFLKSWSAIKGKYYIDKVDNTDNIDFNKDWTQLESLRDKYVILRLKFDNFTNVQLITHFTVDTQGISFR